jgi:hypothetical protein
MTHHILKTHPEPFEALWSRVKPFEFRRNDRDFQVGDSFVLKEFVPDLVPDEIGGCFTGRSIFGTIPYVLKEGYGIPEGYCIFTVKEVGRTLREPLGVDETFN